MSVAAPPLPASPAARSTDQHAIMAEQIAAISQARRQAKKITRAASIAAFSGWTCAVFAGLTLLSGLFSAPALLLGAALAAVATVELRGSRALRQFDRHAPRRLALNQIALALAISAYAAWCMYVSVHAPSEYQQYLDAGDEISRTLEPIVRLERVVTLVLYTAVIVISVIAQGCMAIYYVTRRRHIADYLHTTPIWAVQALRAAA